ncbi:hypothetical protein Y032_0113g393 [Ancylostoma ceylanicum]|nr:hypothetical protein Y032_0113g393 [Ancylostoma ceylanicum]
MRGNTTVSEQLKQENIAIITVLSSNSTRSQYKTALDSIECYAIQNNYTFMELNGKDYSFICEQKDITFQRHCIVAEILKRNNFTWILFVDSDIGVVHEKRKLEEFIKQDADLIFYERFFNFEVMAGSYFAKKSTFAIRFLRGWADYEFRLPRNFHGRDNGAIHMWLIEVLVPNAPLTPVCWELWRNTTSFETLTRYTLCCREALKNSTAQEVFIYDKGNGWARDSWLTNSYWNPERDFMFHSRKEIDKMKFVSTNNRSLEGPEFSPWFDTLRSPLNLAMCREGKSIWSHEPALIATREELERHLNMKKQLVLEEYENKLEFINRKR